MKKIIIFLSAIILLWYVPAFAIIPTLQLDISDGYYYTGSSGTYDTETIIADSSSFTLYSLLTTDSFDTYLNNDFYIAAAVFPAVNPLNPFDPLTIGPDIGSFSFNGTTYNVTSDMTYGNPPYDTINKDLQKHGIYPTYYRKFGFDFEDTKFVTPYNSKDYPGGPDLNSTGTNPSGQLSYYAAFDVNTSALDANYTIHFDLYNIDNDQIIGIFAPFSHDAQSSPVPEPATMLLFGSGLIGLGAIGRKRIKK